MFVHRERKKIKVVSLVLFYHHFLEKLLDSQGKLKWITCVNISGMLWVVIAIERGALLFSGVTIVNFVGLHMSTKRS